MLHNRCRTFQQICFNRLQYHHPFWVVNDRSHTSTHNNNDVINACYRFQHLRCDVMTQKDQTQSHGSDTADINYRISSSASNHRETTPTKLLPFDAIPCADNQQSNQIWGRFNVIAHQLKQLLTAQWDNRFHEEIDECHRRYGPIFRKSLAQNQGMSVFV